MSRNSVRSIAPNGVGAAGKKETFKMRWARWKERGRKRFFPLKYAEEKLAHARKVMESIRGRASENAHWHPTIKLAAETFEEAAGIFENKGNGSLAIVAYISAAEAYGEGAGLLARAKGGNPWNISAAECFAKAARIVEREAPKAIEANHAVEYREPSTYSLAGRIMEAVPSKYTCNPIVFGSRPEDEMDESTLHQRYTMVLYLLAGRIAMDEGDYELARECLPKAGRNNASMEYEIAGMEKDGAGDYERAIGHFEESLDAENNVLHCAGIKMRMGRAYNHWSKAAGEKLKDFYVGRAAMQFREAALMYVEVGALIVEGGGIWLAGKCKEWSNDASQIAEALDKKNGGA